MLNSVIPYNYVEIDNIVKNLNEKEVNLFLNTQKKEGLGTLLNTISNNLISKNKKVAIIDLNTFFQNEKHINDDETKMIFKLKNNVFVKSESGESLSHFFFKKDTLLSEDRVDFLNHFKDILNDIKKDYDYVFIKNAPMISINKNNIQIDEIKDFVTKTYFVIRSNYISKIKMENIKESLERSKIDISGIIINDYGSYNLFDELERQINKISFLIPKSLLSKIRIKLKEYKYNNQL